MSDSVQVRLVEWATHGERCQAIRRSVFTEEQGVPADLEEDGRDPDAWHVLVSIGDRDVATGRMLSDGKIGRMAVLASHRGQGLGKEMLLVLLDAARQWGLSEVHLSAQCHAEEFYRLCGFNPVGEVYDEAGIPHIRMRRRLGTAH